MIEQIPVLISHIRIVLSSEADTTLEPSELYSANMTFSVWPLSSNNRSCSLILHISIVSFKDVTTISLPDGLKFAHL